MQQCCEEFNKTYAKQISTKAVRPLGKDFVQRVRTNKFKVISARIAQFCDFLNIDTSEHLTYTSVIQTEIHLVEEVIKNNPSFEKDIKDLLRNIVNLTRSGAR